MTHSPGTALASDQARRVPAIAAMLGAALLFSIMSACTRMTAHPGPRYVPVAQATFFRFLFGTLVMLPLLWRPSAKLLGRDRPGLVLRGFVGGLSVLSLFGALHYTSLTHAVILNFTSVVFGPAFSAIHLRERITRRNVAAIAVAFAGIALIVRPDVGGIRPGDGLGLLSGVLAGVAVTTIRRLRRTETASAVLFYFCLVGMAIALAGCLGSPWTVPSREAVPLLLVIGISSVGGQMLMTYGYAYIRIAEGVLIMLSQLVYTALIDMLLFGHAIGIATMAGAALIFGAAASITVASAAARKEP